MPQVPCLQFQRLYPETRSPASPNPPLRCCSSFDLIGEYLWMTQRLVLNLPKASQPSLSLSKNKSCKTIVTRPRG